MTAPWSVPTPDPERPPLYVVPAPDDERAPTDLVEAREDDRAQHGISDPPGPRVGLEPGRRVSPDAFWLALWGPAGVVGLVGLLASFLSYLVGPVGTIVIAAVLIWTCIGVFTRQALRTSDRHPGSEEDRCR